MNIITIKILLVSLLMSGWTTVMAASISLVPSAGTVATGNIVTFDLLLDFSDLAPGSRPPPYQGEVLLGYDPTALTYNGFTEAVVDTTVLLGTGTSGSNNTISIGFGNIDFVTGVIGTYSFTAGTILGSTTITLEDANPLGSIVSATGEVFPDFNDASIAVVPLPAAIWLFAGGLLGLVSVARRSRA